MIDHTKTLEIIDWFTHVLLKLITLLQKKLKIFKSNLLIADHCYSHIAFLYLLYFFDAEQLTKIPLKQSTTLQ